jgi:hypothetical protein
MEPFDFYLPHHEQELTLRIVKGPAYYKIYYEDFIIGAIEEVNGAWVLVAFEDFLPEDIMQYAYANEKKASCVFIDLSMLEINQIAGEIENRISK